MSWVEARPTGAATAKFGVASFAMQRSAKRARIVEPRGHDVGDSCHPSLHPEAGDGSPETVCQCCDTMLRWRHHHHPSPVGGALARPSPSARSSKQQQAAQWRLSASLLETLVSVERGSLIPCGVCADEIRALRLLTQEPTARAMSSTSEIEVEAGPDEAPDRPLPKPAFVVWLFAYGYNITASPVDSTGGGPVAELFPYDDAAFDFLQQIDLGRIPVAVLKGVTGVTAVDHSGVVYAEVYDYRSEYLDSCRLVNDSELKPAIRRVKLQPTLETFLSGVKKVEPLHSRQGLHQWTDGDWVGLDRRFLDKSLTKICLDPSPLVFSIASTANYHTTKCNLHSTRRSSELSGAKRQAMELGEVEVKGTEVEEVDSPTRGEPPLTNAVKWSDANDGTIEEENSSVRLPEAVPIESAAIWRVSLSEQGQVARVMKFSSTKVGSKCVEIHRRAVDWGVLVKTASEDTMQSSAFWHVFHTFREANGFCEELKLQYVRMERRKLLTDTLANYVHRVDSAICMDTVFGCHADDLECQMDPSAADDDPLPGIGVSEIYDFEF
eukprot:m.410511 g.410511  ORF g.410511 m.410511 type:complete len:552 (+) comp28467_c0_seq11:182-1837(+)